MCKNETQHTCTSLSFSQKSGKNCTLGGQVIVPQMTTGSGASKLGRNLGQTKMCKANTHAKIMDIKWINELIIGHYGANQLFWIIKHISRTPLPPM